MKKVKKSSNKTSAPTKTNSQYAQLAHLVNSGNQFLAAGKFAEAVANYRAAVSLNPDFAEAYNNLGVALQQQGKLDEAIVCHQRALEINPNYAQAMQNLALAFSAQKNSSAALENHLRALALDPQNTDLHLNLAILYHQQDNKAAAIESLKHALQLNPNLVEAHFLLGEWVKEQGILSAAIQSYQKAYALQADFGDVREKLLHTQLQCCDWNQYQSLVNECIDAVRNGGLHRPFAFLAISDSLADQLQCAKTYAPKRAESAPLWMGQRYQRNKIRIAYLSADFREHAVARLMAGLFEQHDAQQFEIIAISFQPEDHSPMEQRVKSAFSQFIEVSDKTDLEIATLIRALEIEIAVDLMGFTKHRRTAVFSYRPAPIQINYLGYPGSIGADYIDYIFADSYLISPQQQTHYAEKVVYLPDCFQINDENRFISAHRPSRTEVELPKSGFVFCVFNNSYKLNPELFDVWMRLLKKVKNSVLWLVADNTVMKNNLYYAAINHDVNPERLIFAPRLKYAAHLARLAHADLFLDTLPFNAGATASDALWAGVPVITCSGETFAARMAGSLLHAVGLPELITHNLADYETLALKLATTPALLSEIRAKLAKNRTTYPLFNTRRGCKHIESAYLTMWENYQRGESPISFAVQAIS